MLARHAHALRIGRVALWFAVLAVSASTPARADILVLRDGNVLPKDLQMKAGEAPGEADLAKSRSMSLDLAYDVVKGGGKDYPAGQVVDAFLDAAEANENYRSAEKHASAGFWEAAAESYAAAAEELKGSAKQQALYKKVLSIANLGDVDGMLKAADEMLAEFPKSFYFGPVQQKRALALASKAKMAESVAALKTVADAPGMNPRDLFEAEYTRLWLTKMVDARTPSDFTAAEKEFRGLVEAIDRHARGKQDAADQRIKALARVGKALVHQNKLADARKILDEILGAATATTEKAALAAAYSARGDALHAAAREAQTAGKKDEMTALIDDAILDYMRVALMYGDEAEVSDVYSAKHSLARVYRNLFTLSGDKDCEAASRAYEYYRQAMDMLPQNSPARAEIVREGRSLKEVMDKACAKPEAAPPAAAGGANSGPTQR
jgi:tetratricopeptide (TPR) repeat protein